MSTCYLFSYLSTMKRFFFFNPEHDLALNNGDSHFIAPKNIREMAHDLAPLIEVIDTERIVVWGWDVALVERLRKMGIPSTELPADEALTALRCRSERKVAHHLLGTFQTEQLAQHYTGESVIIRNISDIAFYAARHGHILLKNPLSSSGKGLRHVNVSDNSHLSSTLALKPVESWANALIRRHGYLTAEPYYDKVQDFAMEFYVDMYGCHFIGYSLFVTDHHGRYIGSRLMSDERIEELLASYVPRKALYELRDWIIAHIALIVPDEWDTTAFPLHFGIDMMVVNMRSTQSIQSDSNSQPTTHNSRFALHPCVEINLRMNMGIIAHEIYRHRLAPEAEGMFYLSFFADTATLLAFQREQQALRPAVYSGNRLVHGYLPLTPIGEGTRHHAYIICD